jgi:hypothetical protein
LQTNTQNDNDDATTTEYNRDLPGGRHGGDIKGIINLDHIAALGQPPFGHAFEDNDKVFLSWLRTI